MRLVATLCARNEDWVLGLSARAVLMWCDHVVLFNHASTDRTGDVATQVVEEYPGRVTCLSNADPTWQEMAHRQRMLETARAAGATHIAIVDADEVLSGNLLDIECPHCGLCQTPPSDPICVACAGDLRPLASHLQVRSIIRKMPAGAVFQPPLACLARSIDRYYIDGIWGTNNFVSTAFADRPEYHWKPRDGYDFHHRHPMGAPLCNYRPIDQGDGGLMHLQFVSERRLCAKQALYKMTEVIRWPGKFSMEAVDQRYNQAVYGGGATADIPADWWAPYDHLMAYLRLDESEQPWQERQCHEYFKTYGPQKFEGLDLFGVCC